MTDKANKPEWQVFFENMKDTKWVLEYKHPGGFGRQHIGVEKLYGYFKARLLSEMAEEEGT